MEKKEKREEKKKRVDLVAYHHLHDVSISYLHDLLASKNLLHIPFVLVFIEKVCPP